MTDSHKKQEITAAEIEPKPFGWEATSLTIEPPAQPIYEQFYSIPTEQSEKDAKQFLFF